MSRCGVGDLGAMFTSHVGMHRPGGGCSLSVNENGAGHRGRSRHPNADRRPAPAVEFVDCQLPPYESADGKARPWSQPVVKQWAWESVEWVKRHTGPDSVVAHAALHQDERSPHVHVMIVPRDSDGRLGWNRIRNGFSITGKSQLQQTVELARDVTRGKDDDRGPSR